MMRKWVKVVIGVVAVLATGTWLFLDLCVCGPISRALNEHKTGGPYYYMTFNHMCRPWTPVDAAPDTVRPNTVDHSVIEAFFDSKGRVVRLTSYAEHGKLFWRQDSVWDEAGYLKSIVSGQTGGNWTKLEFDRSGTFISETPAAAPADSTWQQPSPPK